MNVPSRSHMVPGPVWAGRLGHRGVPRLGQGYGLATGHRAGALAVLCMLATETEVAEKKLSSPQCGRGLLAAT
jgi:hypothetical protein